MREAATTGRSEQFAGYDMHVPKPVEFTELVAVAASVIRRNT